MLAFVWTAKKVKTRLFRLFSPKSGLFKQKEDQFRSFFSKRSAIRPRSDKADLLGSTGMIMITESMCFFYAFPYTRCDNHS